MGHLISVELDSAVAKRLLKQLAKLPPDKTGDLGNLIFAIEDALDHDDA